MHNSRMYVNILLTPVSTKSEINSTVPTSKGSGPGSVFDIATGYGLNGPGIESHCGRHFPHLSRTAVGPTQPPVQCVPGLSRG